MPILQTWKLTLAYDGTDFRGWQVQPGEPTIQGELQAALGRVTGESPCPRARAAPTPACMPWPRLRSDYAAQGASHWVKTWATQGWRTKDGQPVKHKEVWQAILGAAQVRRVFWHCLKDAGAASGLPGGRGSAEQIARGK